MTAYSYERHPVRFTEPVLAWYQHSTQGWIVCNLGDNPPLFIQAAREHNDWIDAQYLDTLVRSE